MKKQYIAPSMFAVNLLGTGIIATSANTLTTDANGKPEGVIDYSTMGSQSGASADVKAGANVWDEEW